MKLSLLSGAVLALLPVVTADFHVGAQFNGGQRTNYICPSNYFNCACFTTGDRRADAQPRHDYFPDSNYFSATNLCGESKVDFWKNDGGQYEVFINNGDGSVVGRCYESDAEKSCLGGNVGWLDSYWCESYICG